jgi:RNA-directed DNA polymerase
VCLLRPKICPGNDCLKGQGELFCKIVGGVISPLLANIYLHYVLDVWFVSAVQPRLQGRAFLVRYADDFVMGFACEADARRVLAVLPQRFGKYGLTIHPDKTRLLPFVRPRRVDPRSATGPQGGSGESFDFLGFTHFWSQSKKGNPVVKRKTACNRFQRAIRKIAAWCRLNRHLPMGEQCRALWLKLRGHFSYFGIIGNLAALQRFRYEVLGVWRKWLSRRHRSGNVSWSRFYELQRLFPLPVPRAPPFAAKP